ncbi:MULTISPECIES: hypothetical protein [Streptosporangium]|uniref:Aryl-alcohol dehydrogenase-like predicted oxidoreductase n=1 Tax=Streptosporangium brasiliense TaxID=47480 RepID=A0ABT9RLL8_9ACTN|nr:hypothetical protein [Streptosporangium brasiliense]MDP9870179.1 aryl-alcohol dehydrogenase-like predicted oxidoreductase [Streptosporangium brasiliense]
MAVRIRALGRTGIQIGPHRPGTMMPGPAGDTGRDDRVRIIHRAPDPGIDPVGTADVYGPHGESEEVAGRAPKGRRDDTVPAVTRAAPRRRSADERAAA